MKSRKRSRGCFSQLTDNTIFGRKKYILKITLFFETLVTVYEVAYCQLINDARKSDQIFNLIKSGKKSFKSNDYIDFTEVLEGLCRPHVTYLNSNNSEGRGGPVTQKRLLFLDL